MFSAGSTFFTALVTLLTNLILSYITYSLFNKLRSYFIFTLPILAFRRILVTSCFFLFCGIILFSVQFLSQFTFSVGWQLHAFEYNFNGTMIGNKYFFQRIQCCYHSDGVVLLSSTNTVSLEDREIWNCFFFKPLSFLVYLRSYSSQNQQTYLSIFVSSSCFKLYQNEVWMFKKLYIITASVSNTLMFKTIRYHLYFLFSNFFFIVSIWWG